MAQQTTAYRTSEPNADITLYKGPITLSKDSHQVTSEGTLVLQWLPDPRVRLLLKDITSSTFPLFSRWIGEQPILTVADSTESACALVSSFEMDSESGGRVEGILNRALQVGRPEELGTAECYLTNLADFSLSGPNDRMHLEAFEWEVEISAADGLNSLIKNVEKTGGYALTHHVKIRRRDGSSFVAADAELIRHSLFSFFSFIQGRKVGAILPVGYSGDGQLVWQQWASWVMDPWKPVLSWADRHDTSHFGEAYSGFMSLWLDEGCEVLNMAIHWYVEANRNVSGLDAGVVFTQMALELLAWHYFTAHKQAMTKDGFNRLTAADRIRLLLTQHEISLEIPSALPNLARWAREFNQVDAADAIVAVRNAVIHPEIKQRERLRASANNPKRDAWTCGLWMLELLLLRLFSYSGRYCDRRERRSAFVPWQKKEQSENLLAKENRE